MEWVLLLAFVLAAAALIGLPGAPGAGREEALALESLVERRRLLLAELRDLDDDAAAGRISAEDRRDGRRALAPALRAVTEELRESGADAITEADPGEAP